MKKQLIFCTVLLALHLFLNASDARAQGDDAPPKFELGGHFTSLSLGTDTTEPGLGVRLTYNATEHIAFEAEGNLFPHDARQRSIRNGGRAVEGLFGVKIGKRYKRFGIFGKARPGLISFTRGRFDYVPNNNGSDFPFDFRTERVTHFAFDLGGVVEFYPSRRIVTRFDVGDTIIHYGDTTLNIFSGPPGGPFVRQQFTIPSVTGGHNLQVMAGIGFRF